jgi:hypothetical protein
LLHILNLFVAHIIFIWCIHYIFWCTHNVLIFRYIHLVLTFFFILCEYFIIFGQHFIYFCMNFNYFVEALFLFGARVRLSSAQTIHLFCHHNIFIWYAYHFNWLLIVHTWYFFCEQLIIFCAHIKFILWTHYTTWCEHYLIWYMHYKGFLLHQWFLVARLKSSHHFEWMIVV